MPNRQRRQGNSSIMRRLRAQQQSAPVASAPVPRYTTDDLAAAQTVAGRALADWMADQSEDNKRKADQAEQHLAVVGQALCTPHRKAADPLVDFMVDAAGKIHAERNP